MSDSRRADDPDQDLDARCERLEREINRLRSLLDLYGIAIPPAELNWVRLLWNDGQPA